MSLLIDLTIAAFAGWLTNYFLGKSEHGILGYLGIGIIGSIIGIVLLEAIVSPYTHPIVSKLVTTLLGAIIFQVSLNLFRREKKEHEESEKQTKLT
ncbi:hypothetical protein [Wenyingzhuangia sp. IMCC45574]